MTIWLTTQGWPRSGGPGLGKLLGEEIDLRGQLGLGLALRDGAFLLAGCGPCVAARRGLPAPGLAQLLRQLHTAPGGRTKRSDAQRS